MFPRFAVFQAPCAFAAAVFAVSAGVPRLAIAAAKPVVLNRSLNGFDASAIARAKEGAARKLQSAECLRVFTEFKDRDGRPLQESLDKWGVSAAEYLRMIPFLDGSSQKLCRWSKVDLVTTPGTPRVLVCGQFANTQIHDPWLAETLLIHEMLHTLGLGENPPTSNEITQRVRGRCHEAPSQSAEGAQH